MKNIEDVRICVVGLGYVGLPLAVEFGKKYKTIGFDINSKRVSELQAFSDKTLEVDSQSLRDVISSKERLLSQNGLFCTDNPSQIAQCNVFIVTVPTPTDKHNRPILTPLIKASEMIGAVMKTGDIIVYESTVYPGATEEECVPVLEKESNLIFNKDFYVGYSPERINPGDKTHTVTKIKKITSGSTIEAASFIDNLYSTIITAGTFKASSIKVAEAAKVIENSQRDINIAFVNELSKIFSKLNIDTNDVLEAARTKWNFLPFTPGLVGGHCIGVDPYYLAQKAQEVGYFPEIILAGRRLNDTMGIFIASEIIKNLIKKEISIKGAKILLLGITFKENCPDTRNSKVIDVYNELTNYGVEVDVYDPWASSSEVSDNYNIALISDDKLHEESNYDAIVLAVSHNEFKHLDLNKLKSEKSIVYDVKGFLSKDQVDARL